MKQIAKHNEKTIFFEKKENYENYIFGIKEKAAFRYGDRKKIKKIYKNPNFFRNPNQTEPDQTRTEPVRNRTGGSRTARPLYKTKKKPTFFKENDSRVSNWNLFADFE